MSTVTPLLDSVLSSLKSGIPPIVVAKEEEEMKNEIKSIKIDLSELKIKLTELIGFFGDEYGKLKECITFIDKIEQDLNSIKTEIDLKSVKQKITELKKNVETESEKIAYKYSDNSIDVLTNELRELELQYLYNTRNSEKKEEEKKLTEEFEKKRDENKKQLNDEKKFLKNIQSESIGGKKSKKSRKTKKSKKCKRRKTNRRRR